MTTSLQKWAIGLTGIASFMVALDQIVVSTALTRIQQDCSARRIRELTIFRRAELFALWQLPATA
jgi:hypothetical protein